MEYGNSAEAYVERIGKLRASGGKADLLYAALELRCGIEAKLRENVASVKSASRAERREYRASKLGRTIEEKFQAGDDWMILLVICEELNVRVTLNYFPVSARLQKIHDELGAFLHHPLWKQGQIDAWWERLRGLVTEGYGQLQMATASELLVMPVDASGEWHLHVKLSPQDPRGPMLEEIFNGARKYQLEPYTITPAGRPTFYEAPHLPTPTDTSQPPNL